MKKNKGKKVIENNWSLNLKIIKRRKESFYNGSTAITFKEKQNSFDTKFKYELVVFVETGIKTRWEFQNEGVEVKAEMK